MDLTLIPIPILVLGLQYEVTSFILLPQLLQIWPLKALFLVPNGPLMNNLTEVFVVFASILRTVLAVRTFWPWEILQAHLVCLPPPS